MWVLSFYVVIYHNNRNDIELITDSIITEIGKCGISINHLSRKETALFLKYNYTRIFDEKEFDSLEEEQMQEWINPKHIKFYSNKYIMDDQEASVLTISDYPLKVKNGWAGEIFNIPNTKAVMHIKPIEKNKAIKRIDNCILELQTKEVLSNTVSETKQAEIHSNTMLELLNSLQSENESLLDVSVFITCYNYNNVNFLF